VLTYVVSLQENLKYWQKKDDDLVSLDGEEMMKASTVSLGNFVEICGRQLLCILICYIQLHFALALCDWVFHIPCLKSCME